MLDCIQTSFDSNEPLPSNLYGLVNSNHPTARQLLNAITEHEQSNQDNTRIKQLTTLIHKTKAYNTDKFRAVIYSVSRQLSPRILTMKSRENHNSLMIKEPQDSETAKQCIALYLNVLNLEVPFILELNNYHDLFNTSCNYLGVQNYLLENIYTRFLDEVLPH